MFLESRYFERSEKKMKKGIKVQMLPRSGEIWIIFMISKGGLLVTAAP